MSSVSRFSERATHGHPARLQHHFDNPTQQYEASVQGMWLFLATEILLFGGLFCAYAVFRANHPEIFEYAHEYLSKLLGAVNTVILLCSSFTMAAGVWAAHHGRQRLLAAMLALTILGGLGFLGIKYVEYEHKWKEGLLWGKHFKPLHQAEPFRAHEAREHGKPVATSASQPATDPNTPQASWVYQPSDTGPRGLLMPGGPGRPAAPLQPEREVRNIHTFFGVYFAMTGLHGLHVIAGIAVIAWVLVRTLKGEFTTAYSTPVPLVGLYWHVVDLIWIYLFPLLYLIH